MVFVAVRPQAANERLHVLEERCHGRLQEANPLAIRGVRDISKLPLIVQMTIVEDGNSPEGTPPEIFAKRLIPKELMAHPLPDQSQRR